MPQRKRQPDPQPHPGIGAKVDAPARKLTDAGSIRALAHPVRLALLDAMVLEGPLTATRASELVGESPSNCSFHLRQLAKYDFIEEADPVPGRQRPWRLKTLGTSIASSDFDTSEASVAAEHLSRMYHERWLARLRAWWAAYHLYPTVWQEAAEADQTIWWVTPDELKQLNRQLAKLTSRYRERLLDPARRPSGSVPVEFLAFYYPLRLPDDTAEPK